MVLDIILICFGLIVVIQLIYYLLRSHNATDFTYYLCRPLFFTLTMFWGTIVWIICIILATWCLDYGISDLIH
jgi:hypothetical protein